MCILPKQLALLVALLTHLTLSAQTTIWYVDIDATGTDAGTSWGNAFTDLQSALDAADAADQIWVAEGVYRPEVYQAFETPAGDSAKGYFYTAIAAAGSNAKDYAILGGFDGTETNASQRDPDAHPTVLRGSPTVTFECGVVGTGRSPHILYLQNVGNGFRLDGFELRNAYND